MITSVATLVKGLFVALIIFFSLSQEICAQTGDPGSISNPALSAAHLKAVAPDKPDGLYWIDPDGPGGDDPFMDYLDLTTDDRGWTLVLLSNTAMSGCPRPYWDELVNTSNLNLNGFLL